MYKEDREHRVKETYNIMSSIENFYKDRIQLLKERLAQERVNRKNANYAQRKMLSEMERELRQENKDKMRGMINHWKNEKDKFNGFLKEDGKLESEFLKLFKKYQLN